MPGLTPISILNIVKLLIYSPLFVASFALLFRHGFQRSAGWLSLAIFCLMRLMGSAAQLVTINHPYDTTAYIIADVLLVIGLAPLLVTSSGLIGRAIRPLLSPGLPTRIFTLAETILNLISIAAIVLVIIAATSISSVANLTSQPLSNIGKILFAVVFVGLVGLTITAGFLYRRRASYATVPPSSATLGRERDHYLILAVAVALPLLLVRLLYSLLGSFASPATRGEFSPFTGSLAIQVGMSVWEEMLIVIIYVAVGFVVGRVLKEEVEGSRERSADAGPKRWYENGSVRYIPVVRKIAQAARRRDEKRDVRMENV